MDNSSGSKVVAIVLGDGTVSYLGEGKEVHTRVQVIPTRETKETNERQNHRRTDFDALEQDFQEVYLIKNKINHLTKKKARIMENSLMPQIRKNLKHLRTVYPDNAQYQQVKRNFILKLAKNDNAMAQAFLKKHLRGL